MKKSKKHELLTLYNVGKVIFEHLQLLGIDSIKQLAQQHPDDLFIALGKKQKRKPHLCEWDAFAAIIQQARTGRKIPWHEMTKVRKIRQHNGTFLQRKK